MTEPTSKALVKRLDNLREVEELAGVIQNADAKYYLHGKEDKWGAVIARAVLSHLAKSKGSELNGVTDSPISQEGSIAPAALSEGGE
jgi:hypothetical protein